VYGPCRSTIGGGPPLSAPRRHSLGEPLPRQLADIEQANPLALKLYSCETIVYYSAFRQAIHD
jgi:hypothetical protein